jgi:hypothetical protein
MRISRLFIFLVFSESVVTSVLLSSVHLSLLWLFIGYKFFRIFLSFSVLFTVFHLIPLSTIPPHITIKTDLYLPHHAIHFVL